MKKWSCILVSTVLIACNSTEDQSQSETASPKDSILSSTVEPDIKLEGDINFIVFETDTVDGSGQSGWGYDIYINDKRMIRQSHIPAVEGVQTFESKSDAGKVAGLVTYKLKNQIMPPSVSIEELDSLEIVKK
jgi:hypothetical protein